MGSLLYFIIVGVVVVGVIILVRNVWNNRGEREKLVTRMEALENSNQMLEKKVEYMRDQLPKDVQEKLELARFKQAIEDIKDQAYTNEDSVDNADIGVEFASDTKYDDKYNNKYNDKYIDKYAKKRNNPDASMNDNVYDSDDMYE